jgi:hypothetical protein
MLIELPAREAEVLGAVRPVAHELVAHERLKMGWMLPVERDGGQPGGSALRIPSVHHRRRPATSTAGARRGHDQEASQSRRAYQCPCSSAALSAARWPSSVESFFKLSSTRVHLALRPLDLLHADLRQRATQLIVQSDEAFDSRDTRFPDSSIDLTGEVDDLIRLANHLVHHNLPRFGKVAG